MLRQLFAGIIGEMSTLREAVSAKVEVCVSANFCNDATIEFLEEVKRKYSWLKYTSQGGRVSFSENLHAAISLSAAEYVWLMGDDDFLMPNAIGSIIKLLDEKSGSAPELVVVDEAEYDRETGVFSNRTAGPYRSYSPSSSILLDWGIERLGHISRLIIRRKHLTDEVYRQQRKWDIMPFLRWVVVAIAAGRHDRLGQTLIVARYEPNNPHWRGRWMYCHACELPEIAAQAKQLLGLGRSDMAKMLSLKNYCKAYLQLGLSRRENEEAWLFAKRVRPKVFRYYLAAVIIDCLVFFKPARLFMSSIVMRLRGA
jgi:hypothetical protein